MEPVFSLEKKISQCKNCDNKAIVLTEEGCGFTRFRYRNIYIIWFF